MADLAMVPDPEGLLMLLEKATEISTCKDDGRAAFKSGRHQEALALYNEALQMSCGVPALEGLFLSNICACEQALGRYADALSSAGTAVAVAPSFVKAHSRLATIYSELGMLSDAQAAYRTMMQLSLDDKEETQAGTNPPASRRGQRTTTRSIGSRFSGWRRPRGQLTSRRRIGSWRSCIIPIRRVRAA